MHKKNTVGAVIIGGDFQALGVIRSLAENDIPVFLLDHELGIARYSRYAKRRAKNYSLLSEEVFVDYLIRLAEKENLQGWVLFPNNDHIVKLLSIHRDNLNKWYRNPVPPWETTRKFYYKEYAYEIAENLSIPVPRLYRGGSLEKIIEQNVQFPIVLKPSFKENYYPKTKKKAIKVETIEELINEYRKMSSIIEPSQIIVQEMIEGGPKNLFSYVTVFDGEKDILGMSARRRRQHPMDFGHATTYAEPVTIPHLKAMSLKLLKALQYYGLAEVEFMKDDKDGLFKFIEINGRVWGWHTLAKAAGINLPLILFQHMVREEIEYSEPINGVKWIRLATDIPTVFRELISGRMKFGEYINSLKGKKEFAVFSLNDPLPFFMEFLLIPYLWRKRGF